MDALKKLFIVLLVNLLLSTSVFAASASQAKAFVEKALDYIQANGTQKAYKEFNTRGSQFFDGELYIFVYDLDGNVLAHGGIPALIGRNSLDAKTVDGKLKTQDYIQIIKTKGEGWYDYRWLNPKINQIEDKSSFIKKIPNTNAFLGSGFYKPR
jgi:signal transduction histidine kinase